PLVQGLRTRGHQLKSNLMASGANDSEIYIWDLNNFSTPMTPGAKSQPSEDISCVGWNRQVQHILASAHPSGRAVVWDLRKNEPIIKVSDHSNRMRCSGMAWNPDVATQLVLASEDDRMPVLQIWDLRFATSPLKISSSFNNLDPFGTGQTLPLLDISQKTGHPAMVLPLKKPPKWIRRPVGASFAFGGKLITFCNSKAAPPQIQQPASRQVFVSVVTTETEFLCRSSELQTALQSEAFVQYCQSKINTAPTDFEKNIWNFLKVNFEQDPRTKYLNLLGYSKEGLDKKIASSLGNGVRLKSLEVEATERVQKMPGVSSQSSSSEESIAAGDAPATSDFFDNIPGQRPVFEIPVTGDTEGLISQALLIGNFEGAVELCLKDDHFADAIILAIAGGEELLAQTQNRYFAKRKTKISRLVSSVVTHNWRDIVESCDLDNWKEALAALLTYAKPEVFPLLCDTLGSRLEMENEGQLCMQACLCYICSGNVEKLVECWAKTHESSTPLALEDLVEKIMILQKAIELLQGTDMAAEGPVFAKKLTQYASLLAAQGSLEAAMSYLPTSSDQFTVAQLRDRLFHAQGEAMVGQQPPTFPFNQVVMRSIRPTSTPAPTPARQTPPQRPIQPIAQQMPYQTSFSPQAPLCPSAPTVFTPQPVPVAPATVFPAQGIAGMYSKPGAPRPTYPQHPTTVSAPAFSQFQNFGQQKVPPSGLPAYPLQNPLPGSGLTGPSLPTASLSGPTMPGVSMPGPSLMTPTSMSSYQPSNPLPPSHGTQPGTLPTYPGHHQHQPHPPTSLPGIHSTFPHPTGTGGPGAPSSKPFTSAAVPPPPPTGFQDGWNDPPAVRAGQRKKMLPDNYTPPAPITAPVVNFSTDIQQLRPQGFTPQEISQGPPGAPKEANLQPLQQLPTEKIVKKQIPEEHMVLKTTFDGLVQRCLLAAGDPQTKRKLDDAAKRLDYLYDKLREQTLSPHILSGLHEIVRNIEECNYQQALAVHTHVVSSSNFSEISAFMPVLKVVVTIANKLNI
ncbi:hypothetical protein scyTo_0016874, partial [Scyliorhinus torazame]|nr:hypothetical protein [Scyliorhinus torazame]